MKTVGIIGGIGPESTIEYYRYIISFFRKYKKDGNYPEIIINSINMKKMLDFIGSGNLEKVTKYLTDAIRKVTSAGADFGVLASNTPHIVFNEIRKNSPIPLLSIVEETCKKAKEFHFKKVGLFGTIFTMQNNFYENVFSEYDISVVVPNKIDQQYIHDKYMNELVHEIVKDETKSNLLKIAESMKNNDEIQGLILGGTELPLILKDDDEVGIPYLNTTIIHVESIIDCMFSSPSGSKNSNDIAL